MLRLIGIDAGFASIGYAILDLDSLSPNSETVVDLGVIRTELSDKKRKVLATEDNFRRAREIFQELELLYQQTQPRVLCVESMSWPRNAASSAKVGIGWGCIVSFAHVHGLAVTQASPQEIKKRVCGKKDASKEEIQAQLIKRYPSIEGLLAKTISTQREHACDALAAIVTGFNSEIVRFARGAAA